MIPARKQFIFENYGGSYQLRIRTAEDLAALQELDEPFWVATSAPVDQLACDAALLERLDRNHTKRIQSDALRDAAAWLLRMLRDRSGVDKRHEALDLNALDTSHEDGKRLLEAARRVLSNIGAAQGTLSLAQVRDRQAIFARGSHNGDGVVPPDGIPEPELKGFVEDIMSTVGSVADLNGAMGVSQELLDQFLENARDLMAWHGRCEDSEGTETLFPFGDATSDLHRLYTTLAGPIDAYFTQCRVVALNALLGRETVQPECTPEAAENPEEAAAYLERSPLARPRSDSTLMLQDEMNPLHRDAMKQFAESVLEPLLGAVVQTQGLTEKDWPRVKEAFVPYELWLAAKKGGEVESLGPEKIRGYLGSDLPQRLKTAIDADLAAGPELAALQDLEYLILLQRWCLDLCNNFVSFPYLFEPSRRAMFEAGRLIMKGRVLNLNCRVRDVNEHSAASQDSGIFLLYSEVTGSQGDTAFHIVTPLTRGPVGDLGVGKRGVLFDEAGKEWDTRVVKVVENPISLAEAMAAPFRRLGKLVSSAAERISGSTQAQLEGRITETTTSLETGLKEGITTAGATPAVAASAEQPAAVPAGGTGGVRDMVLAGSVAVAALGSSFAFIASKFKEMIADESGNGWKYLVAAIVVGLAIVLIPTALTAFFKLRRRNLSAVLEASGWAINTPMRLTRTLRKLIVQRPPHPRSFQRMRKDLTRTLLRTVRLESRRARSEKSAND